MVVCPHREASAERQPAGQRRDLPWPYSEATPHASTNRTIQDNAWDDPDLMPWAAFVALEDSYSTSVGLAHSQRWPWDASKGVYIVAAGHEMHCLVKISISAGEHELTALVSCASIHQRHPRGYSRSRAPLVLRARHALLEPSPTGDHVQC